MKPTSTIKEIMTTQIWFIEPDRSMSEAETIFNSNPIHHLPVLDGDGVVRGILSKRDYYLLLEYFSLFSARKGAELNTQLLKNITVKEIMSQQVAVLNPEDSIFAAAAMLLSNQFHAVPVVDNRRHLIGLVTTYDLLKYAYHVAPQLGSGELLNTKN